MLALKTNTLLGDNIMKYFKARLIASLANDYTPTMLVDHTLESFLFGQGEVVAVDNMTSSVEGAVTNYIIDIVFCYAVDNDSPEQWLWDVMAADLEADFGESLDLEGFAEITVDEFNKSRETIEA